MGLEISGQWIIIFFRHQWELGTYLGIYSFGPTSQPWWAEITNPSAIPNIQLGHLFWSWRSSGIVYPPAGEPQRKGCRLFTLHFCNFIKGAKPWSCFWFCYFLKQKHKQVLTDHIAWEESALELSDITAPTFIKNIFSKDNFTTWVNRILPIWEE